MRGKGWRCVLLKIKEIEVNFGVNRGIGRGLYDAAFGEQERLIRVVNGRE